MKADIAKFAKFHKKLMENRVFIPPSQFETCFISTAHLKEEINETIKVVEESLRSILK
jgi:glutamate-1-semialdehyde 2,1-aminomutase